MKWIFRLSILLLGFGIFSADARFPHGSIITNNWAPIKIGNGGFIVRFDIANDGTMVAGTDSFGCYLWGTPTANTWNQLFTSTAIGALASTSSQPFLGSGCDDIAVDHTNSNNVWVIYAGNVYKSTNKSVTFNTTGYPTQPTQLTSDGNPAKNYGPYSAIDPANSNIAYFSTSMQGVFFTSNGGTSFGVVPTTAGGLSCTVVNSGAFQTKGTDTSAHTPAVANGVVFNANNTSFGFDIGGTTYVKVWSAANPAEQMVGLVTASGTNTFTMNVLYAFGSSSHSDWIVGPAIDGGNSGFTMCGSRIVFDTHGGTQANVYAGGGLCTSNVFIHSYGVNIWKSTDCGQTWTPVNQTGKPTTIRQMTVDLWGVLWTLDDDYSFSNGNVKKYDGTTWSVVLTGNPGILFFTSLAVDPLNCPSKITCHVAFVAGGNNDAISLTTDGATVPTFFSSGGSGKFTFPVSGIDVDWFSNYLTTLGVGSPFSNNIAFDPVVSGKLWSTGEGIFSLTPPAVNGATVAMTQQTRGIEEFIAIKAMATPNTPGGVMLTAWDFPCFFTNTFSVYPTTVTCQPGNAQQNVERGYSVDWAWNSPSTVVSLVQDGSGNANSQAYEFSGISTTGGATPAAWTKFAKSAPYQASATGSTISAQTFTAVGSITSNVLTITSISAGSVRVGATITGSGGINTVIGSRLSGSAGGIGTFSVGGANAASTTLSGTYGLFTVGTVTTAQNNLFTLNSFLDATGNVPTTIAPGFGPQMTELISGTGGSTSTFAVNNNTAVASQTISQLSGASGGCIAIKDATHFVVIPSTNQAPPQFTTNGGASWADTVISGGTPTAFWGPTTNYLTDAKVCDSDKANGDIYVYNVNVNNAGPDGFYKSTDGGGTFTAKLSPGVGSVSRFNEQLKSVGVAGNLFFTSGLTGGNFPQSSQLWHFTTDGWTSVNTTVTGFKEVLSFAYGATWPTKAFPGLYAAGWYSGTCIIGGASQTCTDEYGIWMCKEFNTSTAACNTTWTRLGDKFPMGIQGIVVELEADKVTPGLVEVWTNGGAFWGQFNFLLKRDLDPTSNDNDPMWLEKAA